MMKYKYKNHIYLELFSIIILIMFLTLILQDNKPAKNKQQETTKNISIETTTSYIEETTVFETETATEETTSKSTSVSKKKKTKTAKKLIDFTAEHPYRIKVNRDENFAVVYGIDKDGKYSIPYKAFVCSTGKNADDTPLGSFHIYEKYRWRLMVDGTYAQYAVRIFGQIMLHSVPYENDSNDTLEYWEYNKLGSPASLGCIRFRVTAIKWIYDHCDEGTMVDIYSNPGEEPPLELTKIKKLKKSNPNKNWDPTDPDENNPWREEDSSY